MEENKNNSNISQTAKKNKLSKEDFDFLDELGQGAFGDVFKVCKKNNKNVFYALKVVSKAFLAKVYMEKEVLKFLKHDGIVKLEFSFQDTQNLYFGIEYADGGNFSNFIRLNFNMSLDIIKFYTAEIILILEYIHSKGIAHRDLKPENLMLMKSNHIKLIDFGTAKFCNPDLIPEKIYKQIMEQKKKFQIVQQQFQEIDNNTRPRADSFVGTAEYVAPELLENSNSSYQSDLWALGCIIYKLFKGKTPFQDINEFLIFQKIKEGQYEFSQNMTEQAKDLISRLLQKNPEDRLGAGEKGSHNDYQALKNHPFFQGINWNNIFKEVAPQRISYSPNQFQIQTLQNTEEQKKEGEIIFQGEVQKQAFKILWVAPIYKKRMLKLFKNPARLVYYDIENFKQKGEIPINRNTTEVQLKDQEYFIITIKNKRKYIFKVYNSLNQSSLISAKIWVQNINQIMNDITLVNTVNNR